MKTKEFDLEQARLIANRIASIYVEKFPREVSYELATSDEESGDHLPFCIHLSDAQLDVIRKYYKIAEDEKRSFGEVLKSDFPDVEREILSHDPSADCVESVDIKNPVKFTNFSFCQINGKGQITNQGIRGITLTDQIFKELLVELMIHKNKYTTNMMAYQNSTLAKEIIYKLDNAVHNWLFENTEPTVYDFHELKCICDSILNPFKDILNLFDSTNKEIRDFALAYQVEAADDVFYFESNDEFVRSFGIKYEGTSVVFWQHNICRLDIADTNYDEFSVDANAVIKKFELSGLEDIFAYLKEKFSSVSGYEKLKKEFENESRRKNC